MPTLLERCQQMVRGEEPPPPIGRLLGFALTAIEPGRAVCAMAVDDRHHNPLGTLHGGVYCDLADPPRGRVVRTSASTGSVWKKFAGSSTRREIHSQRSVRFVAQV